MICTTLILWYLHVNDVQNEKQAKSERLTLNLGRAWSFELLPLDVLSQQEKRKRKCQALWFKRKNKGFGFLFGISGFFMKVSDFLFSFDSSLFPKASLSLKAPPLERVMEKSIYRWICCDFGEKDKWDFKSIWHPAPLFFHHCFRMLVWCNYGMHT